MTLNVRALKIFLKLSPQKGAGSRGLEEAECGRGARLNLCTNIADQNRIPLSQNALS